MTRTRTFRRHHIERIRRKRKRYWGGLVHADDQRRQGICERTPKPCNCWMCNKPRKVFGVTLQEMRHRYHSTHRLGNQDRHTLIEEIADL